MPQAAYRPDPTPEQKALLDKFQEAAHAHALDGVEVGAGHPELKPGTVTMPDGMVRTVMPVTANLDADTQHAYGTHPTGEPSAYRSEKLPELPPIPQPVSDQLKLEACWLCVRMHAAGFFRTCYHLVPAAWTVLRNNFKRRRK